MLPVILYLKTLDGTLNLLACAKIFKSARNLPICSGIGPNLLISVWDYCRYTINFLQIVRAIYNLSDPIMEFGDE